LRALIRINTIGRIPKSLLNRVGKLNIFYMKKLNFDDLKVKAEAITSEELLSKITGGIKNACHDEEPMLPDWIRFVTH